MSFTSILTTPFTPSQINSYNGIKFLTTPNLTNIRIEGIGNFNSDRIEDLLVSRSNLPIQSTEYFVIYGSPFQPPSPLDLDKLVPLDGNFLRGKGELLFSQGLKRSPFQVTDDLDGDGVRDFIRYLGDSGRVLLSRGNRVTSADILANDDLLDGNDGFTFNGFSGPGVLPDLNGDGIKEFVGKNFVTNSSDNTTSTEISIIFGTRSGFPPLVEPSLADGVNGFKIKGVSDSSKLGILDNVRDLNGDGRDDLIVEDVNGRSYILFSLSRSPAVIDLNNIPPELGGSGVVPFSALYAIGDINKDGLGDFFVDTNGPIFLGGNRIIYGSKDILKTLSSPNNGGREAVPGTTVFNSTAPIRITDVKRLGDVNGDGVDDIMVDFFNPQAGRNRTLSYSTFIFGKVGGLGDQLQDQDLADPNNGFSLDRNRIGARNVGIGDFNGDGINDLQADNKILFGGRLIKSLTDGEVDGKNGFMIKDLENNYLSPVGDINGDGSTDLAGRDLAGNDFVIYGTNQINFNKTYNFKGGLRAYNHNDFPDPAFTNADPLNYTSIANAPSWVYGGTGNDLSLGILAI